jgi:hypothetical protein
MSKRQRVLRDIERRWIALFGEPPCIRTDPDLMLKILVDYERQARPLAA